MARRSLTGDATTGAVSRVRFAPTSNNLLASSWDSGLRLYDADAGALRFTSESEAAFLDCCFEDEYDFHSGAQDMVGLHEDAVTCIEFSQMTGQLVTGSLDKRLQFWDTKTGSINSMGLNLSEPVKAKDCPLMYGIQCLQASPEWNGYVAGSVDGVVALSYFNHGKDGDPGYAFRCHPNRRDGKLDRVSVNCVSIHPCKKSLVTGDDKGYIISWDAQSKKKLLELPSYSGSVSSTAYNCSGQLLAVAPNYYHEENNKVLEKHEIFIEAVEDYKGRSHMG